MPPTLRSLGVYWIIQGDDNQNAFIGLEYRKAGSSPWRTAARPHHRDGRHVVPGSGGGTGTDRDFFRGLAAAQKAAAPGDLFLVGAGVYEETWTINRSGTPGQLVARLRLTIGMLRATTPISSPFPGGREPGASILISNGPGFAAKTIVSGTNITYCRIVQTKELKR